MMRLGTPLLRTVGTLLVSALLVSMNPAPARAEVNKIMVVGDSISQGLEGDYSWRYRLAKHLSDNNASVDFVGPWTGTFVLPDAYPAGWPDVPVPPRHNGAYRPGITFDSDNLVQWGWQMHQAKAVIADNVTTYQPKYLLLELGFNDLAWGVSSPAGLLADLRGFLANARSANPNLRFLIANVVHRTPLNDLPGLPATISDYDALLTSAAGSLSTASSPVALVDIDGPYDEQRDTYDGLHPNVRGEYVIAKAFADTLFGTFLLGGMIGDVPTNLPADLAVSAPVQITATATDDFKVRVSWSHVFGANGYRFYYRDRSIGASFQEGQYPVGADSWTDDALPAGHQIEFYVQALRGDATVGTASPAAMATVKALPEMRFTLATNPARPYTVTVSWQPVPGADDYHVYAAPGCESLGLPVFDESAYTEQQWALGGKTSWTQEYVMEYCRSYQVVASRYGGEGPRNDIGQVAWPYRVNRHFTEARGRYLGGADAGDQQASTTGPTSGHRDVVVARGFIADNDTFTSNIGDHRGFDHDPYASAKIGVAWDTGTGEIGVYVHKSCVIGSGYPPIELGCKDALPIRFVPDATVYGDDNGSPYNYVSVATAGSALVVSVSAMNAWSSALGRINATVTIQPREDGTYSATLVGDKFPAWEIYRYPWTSLDADVGDARTIGTRDQTSIGDLTSGAASRCTSPAAEQTSGEPNPMVCA
jgi:hypothetical protein